MSDLIKHATVKVQKKLHTSEAIILLNDNTRA